MEGYLIGAIFFLYSIMRVMNGDRIERRRAAKTAKRRHKSKLLAQKCRKQLAARRAKQTAAAAVQREKLRTKLAMQRELRCRERQKSAERSWMAHQKNLLRLQKQKRAGTRRPLIRLYSFLTRK